MTIKYEIDLDAEDIIDELQDDVLSAIFGAVSNARAKLQTRTQERGVDINGDPFKKYSKSYKAYKESEGRDVSKVDLTFTGKMWKAIKTQDPVIDGEKIVCEIKSTTPDATEKIIENEQRGRKFFDLNEKERDGILSDIRETLSK